MTWNAHTEPGAIVDGSGQRALVPASGYVCGASAPSGPAAPVDRSRAARLAG